jgi:enamine deaminase RidA (YjgF/YER057c/UK114 family)
MERMSIDPWEWSKGLGFSQAVRIAGAQQVLLCSGQTAIGADGSPPTTDDMAEQIRAAFANLTTVLEEGGMRMADVVKLIVYTTDVDAFRSHRSVALQALGSNLPAMTLVGVARLAMPELKIEIEATAIH